MTAALPLIPVVDARLGGPLATARAAAVQMSDLLATARLIYSPPLLEAMDRVSYVGVITAIGRRDGLRPRSISRRCSHTARSCRSIGVEGRQGSGAGSSIRSTALTISCGAFRCGASRSHTRSQGSGCGGFDRTPKPGSPTAEPIVRRLTAGARRIRTRSPTVGFAVGRAAPEKIAISAKESPSLFEGDQRFESAFLQRGVQQTSTSFITSAPAVS